MKLGDIIDNHIYPHIISEFCAVFDIDLFDKKYLKTPQNKDLQRGRIVEIEFELLYKKYQKQIGYYQKEKYEWKTPIEVAALLQLDIDDVLDFFNDNVSIFKDSDILEKGTQRTIEASTRIKAISRYFIHKEIQRKKRMQLINKYMAL